MFELDPGRLGSEHQYRVFTFVNEEEKAAIEEACAMFDVSVAWLLNYALHKFLFDLEDEM